MSASSLFIISVLFSLFHQCAGHTECYNAQLHLIDSDDTWPHFFCRLGRRRSGFPILLPAYHRKPSQRSIESWIWVKKAWSNKPFINKQETVYIPRLGKAWSDPWFAITIELNHDLDPVSTPMPTTIDDIAELTKEIRVEYMSIDRGRAHDAVLVDNRADEAIMNIHPQPFIKGKMKNLLDVENKFDAYYLQAEAVNMKEKLIADGAWAQLLDYLRELFQITQDIQEGKLHEVVTATKTVYKHPSHSLKGNRWVLAERGSGENFWLLPFIGSSKPFITFGRNQQITLPPSIELDTTPPALLKFTSFSEYGVTFTLRVDGREETYTFYWFNQLGSGCVLHGLQSMLQKDGEALTAQRFMDFVSGLPQKVKDEPCVHCGRGPESRTLHTGELRGEHCTVYSYCNAESYLEHMQHRQHFALKLDVDQVHNQLRNDMQQSFGEFYEVVGELTNEKGDRLKDTIFEIKMIGAFNQLLKSEFIPKFFYVADSSHVCTYMHMTTILEDYWLSLDSANPVGAERIYDIERKIKERVSKRGSGGSYDIYAIYHPDAPRPHLVDVNLWKPQLCSVASEQSVVSKVAAKEHDDDMDCDV